MPYRFTGTGPRTYMDYTDAATGRMLAARPGGEYEVRATWDKLPVPPADGFWEAVTPAPEAVAEETPKPRRPGKGGEAAPSAV